MENLPGDPCFSLPYPYSPFIFFSMNLPRRKPAKQFVQIALKQKNAPEGAFSDNNAGG